jgi:SAM-dependent methyltransferase
MLWSLMERHEYDTMAQVEAHHWWYSGMRRIAATFIAQIPTPQTIVDAGCGTGGNLAFLSTYGHAVGFDMSAAALLYAQQADHTICRASIDAIPFASASADLVTSFDVIYHRAVRDDAAAVRECARILKPGGYFLLRVPANDWLRGYHDERVHTARRYSKTQVEALCTQAGLQVTQISFANTVLFPVAVLQRLRERGSGHLAEQSDLTTPSPLTDRVGRIALGIEAWLLSVGVRMPYGVSLWCLAQRPLAPIRDGVHDATTGA